MQFNLIDNKWIPVKRRDGTPEMIAPWEVTDNFSENPVVVLNAPRPDFSGALIQFLIGLVQTTAAPANRIEWKQKLRTPPLKDELKALFTNDKEIHDAFEIGGNGPRFMQDFGRFDTDFGPIGGLLIDAPGENALKRNTDHFVKRNGVESICPACCATALFTMQTNAPMGGQGYRTSLRGGGPLTTLVIGDDHFSALWHSIWLNVLEANIFLNMCNQDKTALASKFPWLAETIAQAREQDIHPAHYFWAMPRRIKLNLNEPKTGECDICSCKSGQLISTYQELNKGTKYLEPMKHHLSPYDRNKQKSILVQPGGAIYRHWLGYVFSDEDGNKEPARVVHEFINARQDGDWQFRLWAFGYDMENMKPRCWYETKFPLIMVRQEYVSDYEDALASLVKAANMICGNLKVAIKRVLYGKPEFDSKTRKIRWKYHDIRGKPSDEGKEIEKVLYSVKEKSLFISAEAYFWQSTESLFYESVSRLKKYIEAGSDLAECYKEYHFALCKEAQKQFSYRLLSGPTEDMDPKKIAIAGKDLDASNNSSKIKGILGLP